MRSMELLNMCFGGLGRRAAFRRLRGILGGASPPHGLARSFGGSLPVFASRRFRVVSGAGSLSREAWPENAHAPLEGGVSGPASAGRARPSVCVSVSNGPRTGSGCTTRVG